MENQINFIQIQKDNEEHLKIASSLWFTGKRLWNNYGILYLSEFSWQRVGDYIEQTHRNSAL